MAYTRVRYGGIGGVQFNHSEFLCDTSSDIENLPTLTSIGTTDGGKKYAVCAIGSKAVVVENKKVYVLTSQNEWVELCPVGGGGGIGSMSTLSDGNGNVSIILE